MNDANMIMNLFGRLGSIYGSAWQRAHPDGDIDHVWEKTLDGLNVQQIAYGLRNAVQIGSQRARVGERDGPPTAGEFLAYCKRFSSHKVYSLSAPALDEKDTDHVKKCNAARRAHDWERLAQLLDYSHNAIVKRNINLYKALKSEND